MHPMTSFAPSLQPQMLLPPVELTRAQVAVVEAETNLRSAEAAIERAVGAPVLP